MDADALLRSPMPVLSSPTPVLRSPTPVLRSPTPVLRSSTQKFGTHPASLSTTLLLWIFFCRPFQFLCSCSRMHTPARSLALSRVLFSLFYHHSTLFLSLSCSSPGLRNHIRGAWVAPGSTRALGSLYSLAACRREHSRQGESLKVTAPNHDSV